MSPPNGSGTSILFQSDSEVVVQARRCALPVRGDKSVHVEQLHVRRGATARSLQTTRSRFDVSMRRRLPTASKEIVGHRNHEITKGLSTWAPTAERTRFFSRGGAATSLAPRRVPEPSARGTGRCARAGSRQGPGRRAPVRGHARVRAHQGSVFVRQNFIEISRASRGPALLMASPRSRARDDGHRSHHRGSARWPMHLRVKPRTMHRPPAMAAVLSRMSKRFSPTMSTARRGP